MSRVTKVDDEVDCCPMLGCLVNCKVSNKPKELLQQYKQCVCL